MSGTSKKNSAVSPVIGTILLVAITVVLIAIITAVVMGLADAEDGKKVGMNAQPDNNETAKAKLILYGGESLSELVKLEMIDHDSPYGEYVLLWEGPAGTVSVGLPYTTKENVAQPEKTMKVYDTRINVKGTFVDGREVILLVQPMTFYDVNGQPPEITKYLKEITFQGKDITANYDKVTSGFTAVTDGYYVPRGVKLTGSQITITMSDVLPDDFDHIVLRGSSTAKDSTITPIDHQYESKPAAVNAGGTFSYTLNNRYSGVSNNPTGQWYIILDIYTKDSAEPITTTWIVEVTASSTPKLSDYIEEVTFQGEVITNNIGITSGFTATMNKNYATKGPGLEGSVITIKLKDTLPADFEYVLLSCGSTTDGRSNNHHYEYNSIGRDAVAGETISYTLNHVMYSGVGNNPTGQWYINADIKTTGAKNSGGCFAARWTWIVEATVP